MNYPTFSKDCHSMLCKYLNKDIFDNLKNLKTEYGFTLAKAIKSGVDNEDSGIGVYAGDIDTYKVFSPLFNPIIEEYHKFDAHSKHKTNLNIDDLDAPILDESSKYIISTRIRVGRNLKNFALGTQIDRDSRLVVESMVSNALLELKDNLSGNYYPLLGMDKDIQNRLIKEHFLFKEGDRFLESAGLNRDWAEGRGIYHNFEKTFLVWINEEDQLRVISMQKGGDIKEVFSRLIDALKELENSLEFLYDDRLGFISSCPTNLGTAMRASVHIKLPNLSKNMKLFKEITDRHNLQIRGVDGEHSKSKDGIYDISNRRRLGVSEVEAVQEMYDGVKELIDIEEKYVQ
jgi:creatine kinase/arginine kinase